MLQDELSVLLFAAQHGHRVLIEPLLQHGANMYLCDRVSDLYIITHVNLCTLSECGQSLSLISYPKRGIIFTCMGL